MKRQRRSLCMIFRFYGQLLSIRFHKIIRLLFLQSTFPPESWQTTLALDFLQKNRKKMIFDIVGLWKHARTKHPMKMLCCLIPNKPHLPPPSPSPFLPFFSLRHSELESNQQTSFLAIAISPRVVGLSVCLFTKDIGTNLLSPSILVVTESPAWLPSPLKCPHELAIYLLAFTAAAIERRLPDTAKLLRGQTAGPMHAGGGRVVWSIQRRRFQSRDSWD